MHRIFNPHHLLQAALIGLLAASAPANAAVSVTADPGYPAGAAAFTLDPEAYTANQRDVKDARVLRQTFQLSQSIDVNEIVLSLVATGTDGGLIVKVFEVADVTASTWSAGTLVNTITIPTSVDLPSSTARLGLTLTAADIFTLPQRDSGTQGYGIEISNADGTSFVGALRHSNDGTDRFSSGTFYTETGAQSAAYRDVGVALKGFTTATDVQVALGNGTGTYLDAGLDGNTNGGVTSTWSSGTVWNNGTGGYGEDSSDEVITVGGDVLDAHHTSPDQSEVTVDVAGLSANQTYDVWVVHVGVQGTGTQNGFYWGKTSGALSLYTNAANPGTLITDDEGSDPQLRGVHVGQVTTDGSGQMIFYLDDVNGGGEPDRSEIDGVLLEVAIPFQTDALETSTLRLEVDNVPFSFRVIEKSTGSVLVS